MVYIPRAIPMVIEGPVLPGHPYFVLTRFSFDHSTLIIELNGYLYATLTRVEVVENPHLTTQQLIMRKLIPLVFLHMPGHDEPDRRG